MKKESENGEPEPKMQSIGMNGVDSNINPTNETVNGESGRDGRLDDVVALLGENMPHDQNSAYFSYLSSFMSLRLMLLKPSPSTEEVEQRGTLLSSYNSYLSSGRSRSDIAVMIARDYMFLRQQSQIKTQQSPQAQPMLSNHSSMEQLSLPSHNNPILGNNMVRPGSYVSLPVNQIHNGQLQQQQPQQQHQFLPSNSSQLQNQRPNQQQINSIDTSNHSHINLPPASSVASTSRKTEPN